MSRASQAFEAILAAFPELRLKRAISAAALRRHVARPNRHCTICGDRVTPPRIHYCSQDCIEQFQIRCWPAAGVHHLSRRDRGICSLCGLDTSLYADLPRYFVTLHDPKFFRSLFGHKMKWQDVSRAKCNCFGCVTAREALLIATWEADHIVPVSEGGGLCGPAGLRTLCGGCHRIETAKLAGRRAASKRTTAQRHPEPSPDQARQTEAAPFSRKATA